MREQIQKEAIKTALENKGGLIDVAVRSGKTYIGLSIANEFENVLVSYPNNSIKESWLNDAEKFGFGLENIIFTTHLSLNKYNLHDFDCIILDEIDQVSEAQWEYISSKLNEKWVKLYGLTGTPPVSGIKKQYIDEYCPVIYSVKLDETVGILQKDYKIIVHLLNPSDKKDILLKSGKFWSEKAKIAFWDNKFKQTGDFMDMLKVIQAIQNSKTKFNYLKELSNKIDRCLIFLETQNQCDELGYSSYHSGNKKSEDNLISFQNKKINKLSCVKQLSAGISFPSLNEVIILHAYASNNKFHQRMARCLQYVEGEQATIHVLCLKGTRDENWVNKALEEFNKEKIHYVNVS